MGEAPRQEHLLLRWKGDDGPTERDLLPDPVPHRRDLLALLRFRGFEKHSSVEAFLRLDAYWIFRVNMCTVYECACSHTAPFRAWMKLDHKDSVSSVCPPQDTSLQAQGSIWTRNEFSSVSLSKCSAGLILQSKVTAVGEDLVTEMRASLSIRPHPVSLFGQSGGSIQLRLNEQ
ncbi:hypothetical protein XENOCAPTIV_003882 [Xenoophorus captivus]|uniref:Uncharacterized protein n=1 Tax=Xenoophorus captivus TaxID=1517983 RepID=A0ABV0RGW3_9TELE